EDTDGYQNADPIWRPISLATDQAPTVAITAPGRDLLSKPEDTVPVTIDARDDYGLAEVRLWYRVNDGPPQELKAFAHQETPPAKQATDRYELSLAQLCNTHKELKKSGTVQYWATATDRNDITRPGQGESRRFSIYV